MIFSTCKGNETGNTNSAAVLSPVPAHPRILMMKEDEKKIREHSKNDSTWRSVHGLILQESNRLLKKPLVEYKLQGKRLLERSREARRKIFHFAYAWRFTNDERYRKRAEEELLNVCAFPDWNPSHFLDVAEMTMAAAIGYDWLYEQLSDESRNIIKESILKKGLQPSMKEGNNWWLTESGNWNQVCNASMAFGALAIYENDPVFAQSIIDRSIQSVKRAMTVYEPDGVYPEGYGYWAYGTTFNVYLIDALQKVYHSDFGLLQNQGFRKTASYLLHMVGPTGLNFNYSDGKDKSRANPAMFWFASMEKNPSVLFSEKKLMKDDDNLTGRELPAFMIWGAGISLTNLNEPQDLLYAGGGKNPVALMRSSWANDAIYIGLKAGSPDNGHGHMDIGSFVMDAMGQRWAMDFGSQEYNSLESKGVDLWSRKQNSQRWNVFRYNNLAHNTLSFNGSYQLANGFAPIKSITTGKDFLSATTDMTGVYGNYAQQVLRGVSIVDGQYVLVRDEIKLNKDNTRIRWSMVTPATIKILSNTTALLSQHGKALLLKVVEPASVTLKTWSTAPPQEYDEPNPGTAILGFEEVVSSRDPIVFTVVLIPQSGGEVEEKKILPLSQWSTKK